MKHKAETKPETTLRHLLLRKIDTEWEQWRIKGHGPSFAGIEALPSRRAFYIDLQLDIRNSLVTLMGPVQAASLMPSTATLRRFIDTDTEAAYRKNLLKALSIYLGYGSYTTFRAAHAHLFEPASFALVHIKREHRQARPQTALIRLVNTRQDEPKSGAYIEDADFSIVKKPWYSRRSALLLTLLPVLAAAGYFLTKSPAPVVTKAAKTDFSKFVWEKVGKSDSVGEHRETYRYDFSKLGTDTLTMEFEKSVEPYKIQLTKKTDTLVLFMHSSTTTLHLSANGQEDFMTKLMGGKSKWHYLLTSTEARYALDHFTQVMFDPHTDSDLIAEGSMRLPLHHYIDTPHENTFYNLSTFGYFPPVGFGNLNLEFRYRLPDLRYHNRDFSCYIYNREDAEVIDIAFFDEGMNTKNSVTFGKPVFFPDSAMNSLEIKRNGDWNTIRLEINNGQGRLYCNNQLRVSGPFTQPLDNRIYGIELVPNTYAEIDYIRMKDSSGKLLYAQEFNNRETVNSLDNTGETFQKICGEVSKHP